MPSPSLRVATPADRAAVVASLVAAFPADPVLRYLFPDGAQYASGAPAFFGHLFDKRVRHDSIWLIEDGAAAAIWEPPGSEFDGEADLPPDALARMRKYDDAVHAVLPATPFWYLGVLGTDPRRAGRGWGRAVMNAGLRRAADDGLPAVLETSNPANVEFYRRGGWDVVTTLTDPVPTWVMRQ